MEPFQFTFWRTFGVASARSRRFGYGVLTALFCISWYATGILPPWGVRLPQARADSVGPRMATSSSNCVDNSGTGTVAWTTPGNAATKDGTSATASLAFGATSHYLVCTNFGFTSAMIPAADTINGIAVGIGRSASRASSMMDSAVLLVKGGTIGTTNRKGSTIWPTSITEADYGGSADLWGTTWAPTDITSPSFGAAIAAINTGSRTTTASVDYIQITVYFSPPPPLFTQSGYRFYTNTDSPDVGSPLAGLSSPAALSSSGQAFRLRELVNMGTNSLEQNGQSFRLQFAGKGSGTCAAPTGGSPSTYTDVSSGVGSSWASATTSAGWSPRYSMGTAAFNNKLWVMSGTAYGASIGSDVWSSSDGVSWTQVTAAAPWSTRMGFSVLVFNNKLWVLGGDATGGMVHDVWSSSDGANWTQVTASAPWSARFNFGATVFNNQLWVLGGYSTKALNDVWSSSDGANWTQVTAAAPWVAREEHSVVAFNNQLWVLGGANASGTGLSDAWSSSDGVNWTEVTANAASGTRTNFGTAVLNNQLWVFGGWANGGPANDVWSSSDGAQWTQVTASAPWSGRYELGSAVLNNQIWVIGGQTSSSSDTNDVWYSGQTAIAWNDNPTPASGANLTVNANDPVDGSNTTIAQTYQEANPFTNATAAIAAGQDGEWDFSLIDNGAPAGITYCLRIIRADGSLLDTYSTYPEITTAGGAPTPTPTPSNDQLMRHGEYFSNGVRQPFTF